MYLLAVVSKLHFSSRHGELGVEVQSGLSKLARRLEIEFNHKELVNDLYRLVGEDLHHVEGAPGATKRWWRNRFEGKAVICKLVEKAQCGCGVPAILAVRVHEML